MLKGTIKLNLFSLLLSFLSCFMIFEMHEAQATGASNLQLDAPKTQALLIFDETPEYNKPLPKRFRAFPDLHIAGSSQFSKHGLIDIIEKLHTMHAQKIWLVDLRQETHFYINGLPVSYYAPKNEGNKNRTDTEIANIEQKIVKDLQAASKTNPVIQVAKAVKKENGIIYKTEPVPLTVLHAHDIYTEQTLAKELGIEYQRFYVLDRHPPSPEEVDKMLAFLAKIPIDDWILVHCRMGGGRTTTFLTMIELIRTGKTKSLAQIIKEQVAANGTNIMAVDVEEGDKGQPEWLKKAKQQRIEFIQNFAKYVASPNGYGKQSWSDWLRRKSI